MRRRPLSLATAALVVAGLLPVLTVAGAAAAAAPACVDNQADAAPALAMARRCARPVEVVAGRTETDRVLANPSGTFSIERAIVPQRVHRPDGTWAAVDTTLRAAFDGSVAPVATTGRVVFSGGGQAPLATMPVGSGALRLSWPGALPRPRLEGDTAVYADVLPGVDLRARALVTGFTYVLVVRTRAAAANPALRELRLPLAADGAAVRNRTGGVEVVAPDGSVLAASTGASMWDSATSPPAPPRAGPSSTADRAALATEPVLRGRSGLPAVSNAREPGEQARRRAVGARVAGRDLVLTPDPELLTDPSTVYPLYIDPSMSPTYWAYSNSYNYDNMTWGEVWTGLNPNDGARYRGYFMFPVGDLVGKHILGANFSVTMIHSWSCGATPVSLFRSTNPIDYRTPWRPDIYEWVQTLAGNAHKPSGGAGCGNDPQPNMGLTFVSDLASEIAANASLGWLTLGLISGYQNESDEWAQSYWKKFDVNSARLVIDVNAYPSTPSAVQVEGRNPSCGSASNPQYISDSTPAVTSYLSDADPQNITGQLEIRRNGVPQYTMAAAQAGNNFTAQWGDAQWSGHSLTPGLVYSFVLYSTDGIDLSGGFGPCYVQVDASAPPGYAEAEAVGSIVLGQPTTVRLKPAFGETAHIGSYDYGYDPVRLTLSVTAGPDGTALVPVTFFRDDDPPLYVRARSRAGVAGAAPLDPAFAPFLDPPNQSPQHRRDDVNGDGRADIAGLQDLGNGTSVLYSLTTKTPDSTYGPVLASSPGAFSPATTKTARGDFDGDGRTDLALLKQAVNDGVSLTIAFRVGTDPLIINPSVNLSSWKWSQIRLFADDANGPSGGVARDDLIAMRITTATDFDVSVLLAAGTASAGIFGSAPVTWYTAPVGYVETARMYPYVGDWDGDHKADIGFFYDYGGCFTRLWTHTSSSRPHAAGQQLSAPGIAWDGGVANYCAYNGRKGVVGDVNGDGRDDITAMYDYGNCTTNIHVFGAPASGDTFSAAYYWGSGAGGWCVADQEELFAGDVDGDGKDDFGMNSHCCAGYHYYLWWFRSQSTSYAAPVVRWDGNLGPAGTPLT